MFEFATLYVPEAIANCRLDPLEVYVLAAGDPLFMALITDGVPLGINKTKSINEFVGVATRYPLTSTNEADEPTLDPPLAIE